jgi:hypothetical protein
LSSKPKCTKLNYVANNHPEDQNKPLIKFCFKQIPSKLKIIQTPAAYLKENKQITQRTPKALEQKKNIKKNLEHGLQTLNHIDTLDPRDRLARS